MTFRHVLPLAQAFALLIACISLVIGVRGADAGMVSHMPHAAAHVATDGSETVEGYGPTLAHAGCAHANADAASACNPLGCCLFGVQPVAIAQADAVFRALDPRPSSDRDVVAQPVPLPERPPRAL